MFDNLQRFAVNVESIVIAEKTQQHLRYFQHMQNGQLLSIQQFRPSF
jgi:hypothetical protein